MKEKRTSNTGSIGQILAGNLFPFNAASTHNQNTVATAGNNTQKSVAKTRFDRCVNVEASENHSPIKAFYPYINKEAMAMTMDNYRLFVANYNKKIREENEKIKKHNAAVERYYSEIKKIHKENPTPETTIKIEYRKLFIFNNVPKRTKEYNQKVDSFCNDYGLLVEKQTYATIKYATEIVFQQMLFLYSLQLSGTSNEYMRLGVTEPTPIKQLDINTYKVARIKRNDVFALDVCKATIRNHRERLEESGILVNYKFRGHKKGVKMDINSEILVVFDVKTGLYSNSENQHFTLRTSKKLSNINEATGTIKSNIKKRENGTADFLEKGTPSAVFLSDFLLEHPTQFAKSKTGAAEKFEKKPKILSDSLEKSILHPQDLAIKLSSGDFNNYKRIDFQILEKEAMYGTLTREEFKQLIIQEFFCNAAKLYRGKNVFTGCWKKAINNYTDKLFTVNNGSVHLYNKSLMVDKLKEMIWRINAAQRWFNKTKINPLFPSDYFDFSRTEKKEIGFEYTQKSYKNHLKYMESKPKLQQLSKKKTEKRKLDINQSKKFDFKLNQFFKNRISLDELIDYTENNLPPNFRQKLSEVILKISTKYTC